MRWSTLLLAVLCACGSVPLDYAGPTHPDAEVARLRVARGKIIELDGTARFASAFELVPGDHEVVASFRLRGEDFAPRVDENDTARLDCRLRANLVAGRRYRVELSEPKVVDIRSANVYRQVHRVRLIDETTDESMFIDQSCSWRG